MTLTARTARLTAPVDDTHWGAVVSDDTCFLLLEVKKEPNTTSGQELLDTLYGELSHHEFPGAKHIHVLISKLAKHTHVVSAIIGFLTDGNLHLVSMGHGIVLMQRGGKVGRILAPGSTAYGHISPGDRLLFCSSRLYTSAERHHIETLMKDEDIDEAASSVAPLLFRDRHVTGTALLLTEFIPSDQATSDLPPLSEQNMDSPKTLETPAQKEIVPETDEDNREKRDEDEDVEYAVPMMETKKKRRIFKNWRDVFRILPRKKKILLIAITVFAIVLIFVVTTAFLAKKNDANTLKLNETILTLSQRYDEAQGLVDLNPVRARAVLSEAKNTAQKTLKSFKKGSSQYEQMDEWVNKISAAEIIAYRRIQLPDVPVFFDMTLIKPGGVASKIAGYKLTKVVLDTQNKVMYSLKTDTKQSTVIAGQTLVKDAKSVAVHGAHVYTIHSEGIVSVETTGKEQKTVIPADSQWGEIVSLNSFTGNLYLLDSSRNTIWKYIATEDGFTDLKRYLPEDARVDFSDATDMEIDGSVWVSLQNQILKFTGGALDAFTLKGFDESLQHIQAISTSEDDKNIYILDTGLSRIIVFDKEGMYQSQYEWNQLKNATDIIASETEHKIFVLIGSKIYGIEIK